MNQSKTKRPEMPKQFFERLYVHEDKSVNEIASECGVSPRAVRMYLNHYNVTKNGKCK